MSIAHLPIYYLLSIHSLTAVVPQQFVHLAIGTPRISGHGFSGTQPRESNGKIKEKDQK